MLQWGVVGVVSGEHDGELIDLGVMAQPEGATLHGTLFG